MATDASFTITVTIPQANAAAALDPDAAARRIAAEAVQQAAQAIGDPRLTSGSTTHVFNFGSGRVNTGSWAWTPPAP